MLTRRGKQINLALWSEIIGKFLRFKVNESEVSIELSCGREHVVLSFPTESSESHTLQRELSSCKPGTKIALMKTDEVSMPLVVRTIGTFKEIEREEK